LAPTFGDDCQAYAGEEELANLLASSIDAFVVCLPIDVQPVFVERILKAGKHVLSEKPIASTVAIARPLVDLYQKLQSNNNAHWSVAENYRYEPAMIQAAAAVREHCGDQLLLVSLQIRAPFTTNNQFYQTAWRKDPSYKGGFFIDAFPHGAAALRMIIGQEPVSVSAITAKHSDHLPDVDTLSAHVQFGAADQKKAQGVIAVTYACQDLKFELEVTGNQGTVLLKRKGPGYTIQVNNSEEPTFVGFGGIEAEFLAFAAACQHSPGRELDVNTPEEALRDIQFVEACLISGQQGGKSVTIGQI
jgi:predicted dehydrogenase